MKKSFLLLCALFVGASLFAQTQTVVYTIASRTTVRVDGTEPAGAMAQYTQSATTGKVGQLTNGNYAILSLTGFGGKYIQSITFSMHSNTSSGGGEVLCLQNDSSIATLEGNTFEDWYGGYSTAFVPLTLRFRPRFQMATGATLNLQVDSWENSLYIESYTIVYSDAPGEAYQVSFETGTPQTLAPLTESAEGSGIVLPALDDIDTTWFFLGWMDYPLPTLTQRPEYSRAGTTFYPLQNTTLYALWSNRQFGVGAVGDQAVQFVSGDYYLVKNEYEDLYVMPVGTIDRTDPFNSRIHSRVVTIEQTPDSLYQLPSIDHMPEEAVYRLEFSDPDSVTLFNVSADSYISYNQTKPQVSLTETPAEFLNYPELVALHPVLKWNYKVCAHHTLALYHQYLGYDQPSVFTTASVAVGGGEFETVFETYRTSLEIMAQRGNALILFPVPNSETVEEDVSYTSYPLGQMAVPEIKDDFVLTAHGFTNPQQHFWQLFTVTGVCVASGNGDGSWAQFPSGLYLLRSVAGVRKVRVE